MVLNEFIYNRLGTKFENKYNALAIKEILKNEEKYQHIYEIVENEVRKSNIDEKANCDWGYFDYDPDIDLQGGYSNYCANYDETFELYQAFVRAFCKDIRNKNYKITCFTYSICYLKEANIDLLLDQPQDMPCSFYSISYIALSTYLKTFSKQLTYPYSEKDTTYTSKCGYASILSKIKESFNSIIDCDDFFTQRFDLQDSKKHSIELDDNLYGYPVDKYEIKIGKNNLIFYTTERGFTPLGTLLNHVLDSLTEKEKIIVEEFEIFR